MLESIKLLGPINRTAEVSSQTDSKLNSDLPKSSGQTREETEVVNEAEGCKTVFSASRSPRGQWGFVESTSDPNIAMSFWGPSSRSKLRAWCAGGWQSDAMVGKTLIPRKA